MAREEVIARFCFSRQSAGHKDERRLLPLIVKTNLIKAGRH